MRKLVLGWTLDPEANTTQLPPHRVERLQDIIVYLPRTHTRVSVENWNKVLRELRSITSGLPGAQGLFSTLQERQMPCSHAS
jgi:hypothetical protein